MNRTARILRILLVCLCLVAVVASARSPRNGKDRPQPVQLVSDTTPPPSLIAAALDVMVLAEFDFEGVGVADPQGWTLVDMTAQPGNFWHIDDFAGLGGGTTGALSPIGDEQSLWCGARPTPGLCHYATLPGYGNNWFQIFESIEFPTLGDVVLEFDATFDSEYGYDFTYIEYLSETGNWNVLEDSLMEDVSGAPRSMSLDLTAPADSLNNSVKFRITFKSDVVWSDEDGLWASDGAVIIDDLRVSDDHGTWEVQDFEAESVGDTTTADGHWFATTPEAYGDYAGLFDGATVLQEDSLVTNLTHFWGFFKLISCA